MIVRLELSLDFDLVIIKHNGQNFILSQNEQKKYGMQQSTLFGSTVICSRKPIELFLITEYCARILNNKNLGRKYL